MAADVIRLFTAVAPESAAASEDVPARIPAEGTGQDLTELWDAWRYGRSRPPVQG